MSAPLVTPPQAPPQKPLPGETIFVDRPDREQALTDRQEVDARTAITRGLADYIGRQKIVARGGRQLQFERVLSTWSEPEKIGRYPSAVVITNGKPRYDASSLQPKTPTLRLADGRFLVVGSEMVADLVVQVWATDPVERSVMVAMLENALVPVDWMYGVRLELPFYFGQRVDYELLEMEYFDSDADAMQRYRRAELSVRARLPVTRVATIPTLQPVRLNIEVTEDSL